jgi:hypothetical protein
LRAIKNSYNYDQYRFGIIADGQLKRTFGTGAKAHRRLFRQGKYELCQRLNDFINDRSYFRAFSSFAACYTKNTRATVGAWSCWG